MNTEGDLECTCDVGPFATCPVCSRSAAETSERSRPQPKRSMFVEQSEDAKLQQRLAEIKAGYMK